MCSFNGIDVTRISSFAVQIHMSKLKFVKGRSKNKAGLSLLEMWLIGGSVLKLGKYLVSSN